ncbi:MAG: TOBE domain-containing protein [Sulfurospirillaceae bacterium]|nr:TOBE domain-containing protein [Sulfurospirillaceae bacterium]
MLEARLWMTKSDKNFLGRGRISLLENIRATGSIHAAAKAMKMSYKAAWDAVDAMNNLSDVPLVERVSGGKGGGGTSLTLKGEEVIKTFHIIEDKHQQFLDLFSKDYDTMEAMISILDRIPLKLSARNQLIGTISSIRADAVSVAIELTIKGTDKLFLSITLPSFDELGISIHNKAIAIIKASSVMIAKEKPDEKVYENILQGNIIHLVSGTTHTEVTLELESKSTITATITNDTCKELGLENGQATYAFFKASSVILGV